MTSQGGGKRPLDEASAWADFSWFGAGPIVGRTLANFGAEVVRIESEYKVESLRLMQPRPGRHARDATTRAASSTTSTRAKHLVFCST